MVATGQEAFFKGNETMERSMPYTISGHISPNILLSDCMPAVLELFQSMQFPVLFSYAGRGL